PQRKVHHGQNVKRLREMLNIKQEALADKINVAQQTLSRYDVQEKLDDELLEKIAKELNIPVEAIKNFTEEGALNIISNTFQDEAFMGEVIHYNPTFNPIDKVVELYERMLKEKEERISFLEKILMEKK
ncbi:MAG: helix-turn-helix domain-containing protein, partial [Candidatus Symbiothrix sp.]|nr:helix-turn-helix domain-containing protein [Candidatus Symbiothrix sp.]